MPSDNISPGHRKRLREVAREFLKEKILDKPFYKSLQEVFDYLYYADDGLIEEYELDYLNSRLRGTSEAKRKLYKAKLSVLNRY